MKRPKMTRVISFRVTEEDWLKLQRAAADSGETPNEWCRTTVLDAARMPIALTPTERIMFAQMARSWFLVENGFQLLADDNLESAEWRRYRDYAKINIGAITDRTLADPYLIKVSKRRE